MNLKIESIRARAVAAPMKRPLATSTGSISNSALAVKAPVLVVSGRFIGAATGRSLIFRIFICR